MIVNEQRSLCIEIGGPHFNTKTFKNFECARKIDTLFVSAMVYYALLFFKEIKRPSLYSELMDKLKCMEG